MDYETYQHSPRAFYYAGGCIMKQRSRVIKPDYFQDKDVNKLNEKDQKLFIGLWTLADKNGMLEYIPEVISGFIFPYHTKYNIPKMLENLENSGFIEIYSKESKEYLRVVNFQKHQNPHPKEAQYNIPDLKELHLIKLKLIGVNVKSPTSSSISSSTSNTTSTNVGQATNTIPFEDIIKDLNTKAQKNFAVDPERSSKAYELVSNRMKEGFVKDDFFNVHTVKSAQWKDNPKMDHCLRPTTLYLKCHFSEYLGEYVPVEARPQTETSKYAQELRKKVLGEDCK